MMPTSRRVATLQLTNYMKLYLSGIAEGQEWQQKLQTMRPISANLLRGVLATERKNTDNSCTIKRSLGLALELSSLSDNR